MSGLSRSALGLAVASPPEGAGVVAAGVVQLTAGLVESIARDALSTWPEARGAAVQAAALRARAAEAAAANTRTYTAARDALRITGAADAPGRDAALRAALVNAADTLLAIVACASDCAVLAAEAASHCEPGLRADAAGAAGLAEAAARAGAALVDVNLALRPDDERRGQARALVATAETARRRACEALADDEP